VPIWGAPPQIRTEDLKDWLTYLASDRLKGRALFSDGLGLAAQYIEGHLRTWKIKGGGDNGSFFQTVKVLGVKTTSRSTVTVRIGSESRIFHDGQGVTFPRNAGRKRTAPILNARAGCSTTEAGT
jgi:hypothetical protein